jgi:hypothetical protein
VGGNLVGRGFATGDAMTRRALKLAPSLPLGNLARRRSKAIDRHLRAACSLHQKQNPGNEASTAAFDALTIVQTTIFSTTFSTAYPALSCTALPMGMKRDSQRLCVPHSDVNRSSR